MTYNDLKERRGPVCLLQLAWNLMLFPTIIIHFPGCVDGTHLKLTVPAEDRPTYMNRKGFTSINCMAVAGPDRKFYAVALHCSGRVHDARVFSTSGLEERWVPILCSLCDKKITSYATQSIVGITY